MPPHDNEQSLQQEEEAKEDNESDKTLDNDQDQYKMAQAKRMYVI